jgi:hypothetical protein
LVKLFKKENGIKFAYFFMTCPLAARKKAEGMWTKELSRGFVLPYEKILGSFMSHFNETSNQYPIRH